MFISADRYDVAVIGGGPAGSVCAATCAAAGLRTLVLERATFPREKVCGDCLNPSAWPLLDRLKLSERIAATAHSQLAEVEFIGLDGRALRVALAPSNRGEIAIKRSIFDDLLLTRAAELGADIRQNCGVTQIETGWKIHAENASFEARVLVAADGRNSTVARLLGLLPSSTRERVGVQTHFPAPPDFGNRVVLRFLREGYCGIASVGGSELNLCLVAKPANLQSIKDWAGAHFSLLPEQVWRTITPLARAPVAPRHGNLLLVGDAARVVEPFTGEGIYYALASGELAGRAIISGDIESYPTEHRALYRGRLWINQLSRLAATQPRVAQTVLSLARVVPGALRFLTAKVIASATAPPATAGK